jgi:hypothetical protein
MHISPATLVTIFNSQSSIVNRNVLSIPVESVPLCSTGLFVCGLRFFPIDPLNIWFGWSIVGKEQDSSRIRGTKYTRRRAKDPSGRSNPDNSKLRSWTCWTLPCHFAICPVPEEVDRISTVSKGVLWFSYRSCPSCLSLLNEFLGVSASWREEYWIRVIRETCPEQSRRVRG